MDLWIYIMGSLYAVSALFRFSYSYSKYLIERRFFGWVDRETCAKIDYQRVDEWIYSTIHSLFIILLTGYSLQDHVLGGGIKKGGSGAERGTGDCPDSVKLTLALSLSYFSLDLVKCVLRLNYPFILHHLCAINLLMTSMDQIGNGNGSGSRAAGSYLMAYLLLLEVNTPLMNLGFLLKAFNFDYNIYGTVWSLHLISYILCRLVMVPYLTYYYYQNLSNESEESLYYQIPNLLIIYLGSSYWAYRQVMGIQRRVLGNL